MIFGAPVVEEVHVVGAVLSCTGLARAWWQAATAKGEFEMTSVLLWFLFAFRSPDDMLVEHLLHEARPLLREDGEWQIAGAETCGKIGRIPSVTRFVNVDQVKRQTPGRVQVDTGSGFCV